MLESTATAMVPNKKLLTPEEVAGSILFLASEEARVMNGAILTVDHGHSCL